MSRIPPVASVVRVVRFAFAALTVAALTVPLLAGAPRSAAAATVRQPCATSAVWSALLRQHVARYPRMDVQDAYKLLQHATMGSEHAVSDRAAADRWMTEELRALAVAGSDTPREPLVDTLNGVFARVHLRPYIAARGEPARLVDAFVATANAPGDSATFRCARETLQELAARNAVPWSATAVRSFLDAQRAAGLPAVHHSDVYSREYQPAYRVVNLRMLRDAVCAARSGGESRTESPAATALCANAPVRAPAAVPAAAPSLPPSPLSAPSRLPTGRVTYRTLSETNNELERLAGLYPTTSRLFALPHRSLLGQRVWALEISRNVARSSGKPVFLMTGLHHSREWPTVELTMEFAWDLLQHDGTDARVTAMLDNTRIIIVPVVNPDGYDLSRTLLHEQKRKNCRIEMGRVPTYAECADPANANAGVDLNRNYGAFWGGGGATIGVAGGSSRGAGPFSEPETQNIRELMTSNQIVVALSNHTPDAKVLRVPSAAEEPTPADVVVYDSLAQALGRDMNWPAGPWPSIYYVASGTMEEMAYYASGTLAFTFENAPGQRSFHPPYPFVVDQYFGTGAYPNSTARSAFFRLVEAAANPALHSVLRVRAPAGATLMLSKHFELETSAVLNADSSRGPAQRFPVELMSRVTMPKGTTRMDWHVNPSLRPSQHAQEHLRESWTVTCSLGSRSQRVQATVARGDTSVVNLAACR